MDKYVGEDIAEAMNEAISAKHGFEDKKNPFVNKSKDKLKKNDNSTADPKSTANPKDSNK